MVCYITSTLAEGGIRIRHSLLKLEKEPVSQASRATLMHWMVTKSFS
jgi:hypothetical protein